MPRFFITADEIRDNKVTITGEDAHHISRSLRMRVGDCLTLADGEGFEYDAVLTHFSDESVTAEIGEKRKSLAESPLEIHVYMAYPKGDKLETVIMKACELGAASVTPFLSEFCVKRPAAEKEDKLLLRYNRIAKEAAKQCGRARIMRVNKMLTFKEMLKEAGEMPALFCYEAGGTRTLPAILGALPKNTHRIAVIVGSEGGFSEKEAEDAAESGLLMTGLGKRILRAETAPLFVLSALSFLYELQ